MLGTTEIIRREILSGERGRFIYIDDFASCENQSGVRFGLSRMAEDGTLLRLARGVYYYPKLAGEHAPKAVIPSAESIAEAIAERERIRIIPYGDQAAYRLGLTGLRISDLKYLTDGAPRRICLSGGKRIYFNHTSEVKMFDFCNGDMQLVSSAIRALGKEMIGDEQKRKIHDALRRVPKNEYAKDIRIPPAWVQEIINDIWNNRWNRTEELQSTRQTCAPTSGGSSSSLMGNTTVSWFAMQDDDGLTAVVRSRQLHIYRNGKKVLVLAGKSGPKIIREDRLDELIND